MQTHPFWIEFISDEVITIYFKNLFILTTWNEIAPENRHMLTILGKCCQSRLKYNHLKAEDLAYKPLYFSPGSKRLEPD